jgi:hypothetical protein
MGTLIIFLILIYHCLGNEDKQPLRHEPALQKA